MNNPLSHVGQTPQREASEQLHQQCQQAQSPSQTPPRPRPAGDATQEPPATHLPQHPQQQQGGGAQPAESQQQSSRRQAGTDGEDGELRHESPV